MTEPTTALAVETWDLTKTFKGQRPNDGRNWTDAIADGVKALFRRPEKKTVVDRVGIEVERGEFFGIIGSNGAGKTTLLKMLSCLLYPDAGGGRVNGYDLRRQRMDVRRSVVLAKAGGWLSTLWQIDGRENLLFRARMCGLSRSEAEERADYVLERLELADKAHDYSWNWSAGEYQKFSLAMTFMARTPLVILDEPTSHLDPRTARLIRDFVKEELNRGNGQTVVMSTHYLEEADMLCDRVAVLHEGRLLACDAPARLKRTYLPERILEVRAGNYTAAIGERIKEDCGLSELLEHFEDIATGQVRLRPKWAGEADAAKLHRALEAEGVCIAGSAEVEPTLDDVYFQLSREPAT